LSIQACSLRDLRNPSISIQLAGIDSSLQPAIRVVSVGRSCGGYGVFARYGSLRVTFMPNKSVKWDAPPVGGFEGWFLSRFGGFVWLPLAARPLP
jgi:hypothetical protein